MKKDALTRNPFDTVLYVMKQPISILIFVVLVGLSYGFFDKLIAIDAHQFQWQSALPALVLVTYLGAGAPYYIGLFLMALIFRYIFRRLQWEVRIWFLWLCVTIPGLISMILKIFSGRARPALLFSDGVYGFFGFNTHSTYWSFPSGHTTTIMGLMYGLCILFPQYGYAFLMGGVFVALSRVLLTHHYMSDVLVTGVLVLFEIAFLRYWLRQQFTQMRMVTNSN